MKFKLRGKISADVAEQLARVKSRDHISMAADFQQGKRIPTAYSEHPEIVTRLRTLQAISPDYTWTDHVKHKTRTEATLTIIQLREPFFWVTVNASDVKSPFVMNYGGHDIKISSTCHKQMPDCVTSLRTVADDPVASATIFHEPIQAVFDHVLRVGASDDDGGALGKVQAYIGMTEEQFRLSLHADLLVRVYGYSSRD